MIDSTITTPTSAASAATASATTTSRSDLDKDTFMKLLIAQLRYQDPTKPMDGTQFVAESAQFTTLEVLQKLQASQAEMTSFQSTLLSSGLIGKNVTAMGADGKEITGVVSAAQVVAGQAYIVVNDALVPVGSVVKITDAAKTDDTTKVGDTPKIS